MELNLILFSGSEDGSEQTHPLKSSSQEPSEPSTPGFDGRRVSPPEGFKTDHIIQIEDQETLESPSKTLYITEEEDLTLQKPITPTPSIHTPIPEEQILSASSLEAQYKSMTSTMAYPPLATSVTPTATEKTASAESTATLTKPESMPAVVKPTPKTPMKPTPDAASSSALTPTPSSSKATEHLKSPSPRSAKITPAPSPIPSMKTDKGKSKVTGKVVSGWL